MWRERIERLFITPARRTTAWLVFMAVVLVSTDDEIASSSIVRLVFVTGFTVAVMWVPFWWFTRWWEQKKQPVYARLTVDERSVVGRSLRLGAPVEDPSLASAVVERVGRVRSDRGPGADSPWTARAAGLMGVVGGVVWAVLGGGAIAIVVALAAGLLLVLSVVDPVVRDPRSAWERADRAEAEARRMLSAEGVS